MKPLRLLTIAATLALTVLLPDQASAKGKLPKVKPTPVPEKSKAFAEIKSVSGDSITIEHSKTATTYKMSNETQIQIDGVHAHSNNLKPGMHVEVTPSSINPSILRSITATTPSKS